MNKVSRSQFIDKLKASLDEFDAGLEKVESRGRKLEGDTRREYENQLKELRERRRKMMRKLEELRAAGDERWQAVKDEAEHAWKALGNSYSYFKSHFR